MTNARQQFTVNDMVAYFTSSHSWPIRAQVVEVILQPEQEICLRIQFESAGQMIERCVAAKTCQPIGNDDNFFSTIRRKRTKRVSSQCFKQRK
ncbi:hypothetical protein [Desulfovibrio inopinatus]|uniref:hypothetical protein n=1 Tax=Desulfovibrio inopinatus TaxID=102109 RepID=UPI000481B9AD|nr:hypothetical protein [Desulfovibrio inopinatus]